MDISWVAVGKTILGIALLVCVYTMGYAHGRITELETDEY